MHHFIYKDIYTRKRTKKKREIEQKKNPFGYPPILPSYNMEAYCFSVSEGTKSKPDIHKWETELS